MTKISSKWCGFSDKKIINTSNSKPVNGSSYLKLLKRIKTFKKRFD